MINAWTRLTARFGGKPDMLGFAADATPSADAWLIAFTTDFMRYPDADHAAHALMSGLRFYNAAFVAGIATLAAVETPPPALAGTVPKAIYTVTAPIIVDVYEKLISHNADHTAIQAAFTQAMPALVGQYNQIRH